MTQLDLLTPCRVPDQGTQCYEILCYLERGGRLTVKKAMAELGVYALSQRIGQLRREYGWESLIKSKTVQVGPKTFVSEYWIETKPQEGGELKVAA